MRAKSSAVPKREDHLTTVRIPVDIHKKIVTITDYNTLNNRGTTSVNAFIVSALKSYLADLEKDPEVYALLHPSKSKSPK